MKTGVRFVCSLSVCMGLLGCSSYQFTTFTLYETPNVFVRLEVDQTASPATHSHPALISSEQMAAVLQGIIVMEPAIRLPIYDDLSQPRRHPAFTEKEVALFAPLLALALGKALPEEVVTFYQTRDLSGTSREVTSGGLFVEGEHLHIILANYRSSTHYSADIGVAQTTDDRLTPMRSLAPQQGALLFEPEEAWYHPQPEGIARLLHWDRRELIIRFKDLSGPLLSSPSPSSSKNLDENNQSAQHQIVTPR